MRISNERARARDNGEGGGGKRGGERVERGVLRGCVTFGEPAKKKKKKETTRHRRYACTYTRVKYARARARLGPPHIPLRIHARGPCTGERGVKELVKEREEDRKRDRGVARERRESGSFEGEGRQREKERERASERTESRERRRWRERERARDRAVGLAKKESLIARAGRARVGRRKRAVRRRLVCGAFTGVGPSFILPLQSVNTYLPMRARARVRVRGVRHVRAFYAYLLTGALCADNDEEAYLRRPDDGPQGSRIRRRSYFFFLFFFLFLLRIV